MRFSTLHINVVAVICIVIAGCGVPVEPLREVITYSYTPTEEAAPGSADVTFAVVGAQLVDQAQQVQGLPISQTPVPLFEDFANTMTKDFMEVLNARGFGVTGPFETYDKIMHPVKEASDLLLTAEVTFTADMSGVSLGKRFIGKSFFDKTQYYTLQGSCTIKYDVTLVLSECLTNEPMWSKGITLEPFTVPFDNLYPSYSQFDLTDLAVKYGQVTVTGLGISQEVYATQVFPRCPIGVFIEKDNKFHADLGHALEKQYDEILKKIYIYLDPREMAIVKNQAMELRKRKVY